MQFVRNGPDIPERLLQAHEDGRVVFFCGAGISYRAGLPGFRGLTEAIFGRLGMRPNRGEKAAMAAGRFDVALGILEGRHVGKRPAVRRALAAALQPNLTRPNATATHEALLTLARDGADRTRLVTTNFDRLFEEVAKGPNMAAGPFEAPLLPVPKRRWSGLVYLHGLLGESPSPDSLERLVLSSGDFGLAYLTERWAARFVSELLRSYIVVFVGYSLTDPVLRYMTDALAADQLLGEEPLETFAFANHARGREERAVDEWSGKNVTPILYRNHARHHYLHRTLGVWAETYRDGVNGKARVVLDSAKAPPNLAPDRDDVASRMLWALSDPTGQPARQFATLDQVPSLEWLDVLADLRHGRTDLSRFGVEPHRRDGDALKFAFTDRPAPVGLASWMRLVPGAFGETELDPPMVWIGVWLARHLNDPRVLLWIAAQGGRPHSRFAQEIERRLEETAAIAKRGGAELLEAMQNAPNSVPSRMMRAAWELVLADRVGQRRTATDGYAWSRRVRREGLSARARQELRALLAPRVVLRRAIRMDFLGEDPEEEARQFDWDIELLADVEREDFTAEGSDGIAFGALLDDFSLLLRDAMDLMRALDGADERDDPSYYHQPSIGEHPQNQRFHKWTLLVELARDAWLEVAESDAHRARLVVEWWWLTPYPVFRRLALFAAAQGTVIGADRAVEWLVDDEGWWLWSVCTHHEVSRLLVALARDLDEELRQRVEEGIVEGPPRRMYVDGVTPERWVEIVDDAIWQHLARLAAGAELGDVGRRKASELQRRHPDWKLVVAERREFSSWIEQGVESPETATPETAAELTEWLRENPRRDDWSRDDWGRRCREDYEIASEALRALAREGWWEASRWSEALYAWTDRAFVEKSWEDMSPELLEAPDAIVEGPGTSFWLRSVGGLVEPTDSVFVRLCDRALKLAVSDDAVDAENPVDRALNHPVGQVVEGLLDYTLRRAGGEGLPAAAKRLLEMVCDSSADRYGMGRVMVASRVLPLLVRDEAWTRVHVLPMFDWNSFQRDACLAWRGFLSAPRFHQGFLDLVRASFVRAARHYDDLGSHGRQYASLLAYAGLRLRSGWSTSLREAIEEMPGAGLEQMVAMLGRGLEADERREDYFDNRVLPFLQRLWPKTSDKLTPGVSAGFARLCLVAGDAFPVVLREVRGYLTGAASQRAPGQLLFSLRKKEYAERFPVETLEFLGLVLDQAAGVLPGDLRACLQAIRTAEPRLEETVRFKALLKLAGGALA